MKKKYLLIAVVFAFSVSLVYAQEQEWQYRDGHLFKNGMLFTGIYTEQYENGAPKIIHNIKDGMEHGKVTVYHQNGKISEERKYNMGAKDSIWISWNEEGVKIAEAGWKNGLKHGFWYVWDDKGVKRYEMYYRKGKKDGSWYMWDENGTLVNKRNY